MDVKLLMDTFGVPAVGQVVKYADIAAVLRVDVRSNRWRTVTWQWRKQLEADPHNILLQAEDGCQFRVMNPSQRIYSALSTQRNGFKQIFRGSSIAARTEASDLTEEERRKRDHALGVPAKLRLAQLTAPKDI